MRYFIFALAALTSPALADDARVEAVDAKHVSTSWTFSVTLRHADTGWDDYADGWRVEDAEGNVLGTRVLHHPHVNEQPFTRSLSGVNIPAEITQVYVRARTLTTGWSTERAIVDLMP